MSSSSKLSISLAISEMYMYTQLIYLQIRKKGRRSISDMGGGEREHMIG